MVWLSALGFLSLQTTTRTHNEVHAAFYSTKYSNTRLRQDPSQDIVNNRSFSPGRVTRLLGWVEKDGEWEWEEDDPRFEDAPAGTATVVVEASATPRLPSGSYKPKQSLGQNYLKDPNTVAKIIATFDKDARKAQSDHIEELPSIVELGPGAGALTDKLVELYGTSKMQCIEIDPRSVELLRNKHPELTVHHEDVLQVNYPLMMKEDNEGKPLVVIGNLPYYITSQILFALADASHVGAVASATVTMQWEVAQRMVAATHTKDYGILSVVFQLYADVKCHFKIPPTVFYPKPKVDSALVGLHFVGPAVLRRRLAGVSPMQLRRVVTAAFQQRRKTTRNSLKKLIQEIFIEQNDTDTTVQEVLDRKPLPLPHLVVEARDQGDPFALTQELPDDWSSMRPEQLTAGQFVELTRLLFGTTADENYDLGSKVWRKLKHGDS